LTSGIGSLAINSNGIASDDMFSILMSKKTSFRLYSIGPLFQIGAAINPCFVLLQFGSVFEIKNKK
jgi:hypothetical protein